MAIVNPPPQDDSADSMRRYDLYMYSDSTNVIVDWQKVEAHSLDAAMQIVLERQKQAPMELWREGRLIRRWE